MSVRGDLPSVEEVPEALRFPESFSDGRAEIEGASIFYRCTGAQDSPHVLLLHGHTQSSDMWAPLATDLVQDGYRVVVADLHGLARSTGVDGRYDKKTIASDFRTLLESLALGDSALHVVGHDLGAFVAYAYAAQFGREGDTLTLLDATVPGVGIWPTLLQQPRTWHFGFYGEHAERLVAGRERVYLDRFWDEFSVARSPFPPEIRDFYTSFYRAPEAVHGAFQHFSALEQDAADNQELVEQKLEMPVLAVGGEASLGPLLGDHVSLLAARGEARIVSGAGHWLMEENEEQTTQFVRDFISTQRS